MSGLSPPTRGSRYRVGHGVGYPGSIPAHAGKPGRSSGSSTGCGVYPRPRGEAQMGGLGNPRSIGLSPPTRGSLHSRIARSAQGRSIPAHAGKPPTESDCPCSRRVYPRPRGEAGIAWGMGWGIPGLSPPTRGSRSGRRPCSHRGRSIPAHAGKPSAPGRQAGIRRRSIPAHAGKPARTTAARAVSAVYPRPRGEASSRSRRSSRFNGLSPPTRGSPSRSGTARPRSRSIPAHAGKPCSRWRGSWNGRVYPRPRGEADRTILPVSTRGGLSPPTRGSL